MQIPFLCSPLFIVWQIYLFRVCRNILDTEAYTAHLIFAHADYFYNIAKADNVFYFLNTLFGELGDVYQTFFSRCEFKESTEVFDADNFSGQDLSSVKSLAMISIYFFA